MSVVNETWWHKYTSGCTHDIRLKTELEDIYDPTIARFTEFDRDPARVSDDERAQVEFEEQVEREQMQRAYLAAAAPELARVLIAIEWGHEGVWCASCGGPRPRHGTDCALDGALRKAGLR